MTEISQVIQEFPTYEITNYGRVFNRETGREMVQTPIQNGTLTVGFVKDGYHYRRSVKVLVARAFVPGRTEIFNTPIQLDGNKENVFAINLMWRPRWFANMYTRQMQTYHDWYNAGPIVDLDSGAEYSSIISASMHLGVLGTEIMSSIYNGSTVFPNHQRFDFLR